MSKPPTRPTFTRQYQKKRKHLRLTPELLYVLDDLAEESASAFVEAAAWDRLIEQHGEDAVREAIDDSHDDLDAEDLTLLAEPKTYEMTV